MDVRQLVIFVIESTLMAIEKIRPVLVKVKGGTACVWLEI